MREQASSIRSWGPPAGIIGRLQSSIPRGSPGVKVAAVFCLIGAVGGLFGGLLGIGGGSAIAPLLLVVTRMRPSRVSGTTLATVLVISIVGSGAYALLGNFDLGMAWPIAAGSIAGSVLGALASRRLSMRLMVMIFLVILPYFAIKEFWPGLASPEIASTLVSLWVLGLVTGFMSGLLGISGASLVVPSLVAFFLIDHHVAQGVAISVALADSTAGVLTHARGRTIDYRILAYLAPPALVAAVVGALLSDELSTTVLRNVFGVFMVAIWLVLLARVSRDVLRDRSRSRGPGSAEDGGSPQDPGPPGSTHHGPSDSSPASMQKEG